MKRALLLAAAASVLSLLMVGCATTDTAEDGPVILVAAFGSSYESGQKNLNDFDRTVRSAFPGTEVYWGFTASFIVDLLRDEGVDTLFDSEVPLWKIDEAMRELKAMGKRDVLVVNFLIMPGGEYREVMATPTTGLNVKYVHSALYYPENIQNAVLALDGEIADTDGVATIFCAHGNEKYLQFNGELEMIDDYLRTNYRNTYLTVMEGTPEWAPVRDEVLASDVTEIKFITFMLTYGDHMSNDVMGEEEDSMKTQLGLPATATDGLASMKGFQDMYINKMRAVLAEFQE